MSKRKAEAAANEAADLQAGEMPAGTSRLDDLIETVRGLGIKFAEIHM